MKIKNRKTGAIVDIRKVSLVTLAERLAANRYISSELERSYELSNTRAYSKSGYVWHSYEVFASEQGDMLTKRHLLHELDTFGNEEIATLSTTTYEEKALTRFSLADICIDVNDHIIEDLGLVEDRYLENIKDSWYSITGIPKYECRHYPSANQAQPNATSKMPGEPYQVCMTHPCANPAAQTTPTPDQVIAAQPQPTAQQTPMVDPVMAAQPATLLGQPYVNPAFIFDPRAAEYMMQKQPYPMRMMAPTADQVMAAQPRPTQKTGQLNPETISVSGIQLTLDPRRDMCLHKNLATGESCLIRQRFADGNMYVHCPQCNQTWMEKPVTLEAVKEAWATVKSAIEYIKVNKQLSHQELKDLIATDLGVFGLQTDIAKIQGRYWPETSFVTSPAAQPQQPTQVNPAMTHTSSDKASDRDLFKIGLPGVPFGARPKDYCPHVDPATGKSVLETRRCNNGNTYKFCPMCKQSWVERPIIPQAMREAYYTVKSVSEYLKKAHSGMPYQQRQDLTATELGVFDLIFDLAFTLGESRMRNTTDTQTNQEEVSATQTNQEEVSVTQINTEPDKGDGDSSK